MFSVAAHRHLFDDNRISFSGVTADPDDHAEGRVKESLPGIRFFFDVGGAVWRLYGSVPRETEGATIVGLNNGEPEIRLNRPSTAAAMPGARIGACRRA